ncbi:hypothetical protein FB107DRAFT_280350 [Schizophyllum commune]
MPTSSPLGLPLAQSSTCRHAITASDLVGPHEHADDVAPAEERCRSSQSHTCKPNLLEDTHLPLVLGAFPLSARSSGRMQAYSEVLKRHPEAWKHAQTAQALQNRPADLEAFFRRPSTGILQLPTYTGANLRADRTLADLLPSYFFGTRTSAPLFPTNAYRCLASIFVLSDSFARSKYSFGGDWYRNLGDSRARASSIARPIQPGRACCARARLQATLPLDFKRSIPHLQPTSPLAFKRLIASPSAHTIPHHPDQMTLQSYGGDYLTGDMRVVGLTATSSTPTTFRPYRHPSDRTDHTRDGSGSGCDDARYTDSGCDDARYTADTAANARDPTDDADACCLAAAAANACCLAAAAANVCCLADAHTA